jgi:predicted RNA-binding Zn-ribbon protein involved in translation (DUF1610 family)
MSFEFPECPHCGHEFDSDEIWGGIKDFPTESDGDEGEFSCPECSKTLHARLSMEPSWTFTDEDGEELSA